MQIADDDLQRYEHRKQPDSHLLHDEALLDMTFAAQMVRGYADHDERGRDEERDRGVHQAEGRIEDDPIPVVRHEAAVDDRMAHRSPASSCSRTGSRTWTRACPRRPSQRQGLGRALLEKGIALCRERKLRLLYGLVDRSNTAMIALARRMGFDVYEVPAGATVVVTLEL